MRFRSRFPACASIALVLMLFAGLPGLALADQSTVQPNMPGGSISGVVRDAGGHPLAGVDVNAESSSSFSAHAFTAADGSYSMSVGSGKYTVTFLQWQSFFQAGCYASGFVAGAGDPSCVDAVVVKAPPATTGIDVVMPLSEGVAIVVTPDGVTLAAGASQVFKATMTAPAMSVVPAVPGSGIDISDVSAISTFTMDKGGVCVGASCTAPSGGDYSVFATYLAVQGSTTLHVTGPAAPVPTPTPPVTSTGGPSGSGDSQDGMLLLAIMFGFAAVASMSVVLRRRVALLR